MKLDQHNRMLQFVLTVSIVVLIGVVLVAYQFSLSTEDLTLRNEQLASPDMVDPAIGEPKPVVRELTGTVVSVDPTGKFMRVAVAGEGIFSVGVDHEEASQALETIAPMADISFTATELDPTARYDYVVQLVDIQQPTTSGEETDLTVDERLERLRDLPLTTTVSN